MVYRHQPPWLVSHCLPKKARLKNLRWDQAGISLPWSHPFLITQGWDQRFSLTHQSQCYETCFGNHHREPSRDTRDTHFFIASPFLPVLSEPPQSEHMTDRNVIDVSGTGMPPICGFNWANHDIRNDCFGNEFHCFPMKAVLDLLLPLLKWS